MNSIYDLLSRFWVLVPNKLGQCPYCMRASARATAAGWATVALLSLLLPGSLAISLAVVVAAGFTALFMAHMLAYTWRVVPLVLNHQECFFGRPTDRGRRQVLNSSLRIGVGAVAIALLGFGRTALGRSDENDCPGRHRLEDKQIAATADDASTAKDLLLVRARAACDTFCGDRDCNKGTCIRFERAGRAGAPKLKNVSCKAILNKVTCKADLESCHCECDKDDSDSTISATTSIPVSQSVFIASPSATGSLFGTVVADVTLNADLNSLQIDLDFTAIEVNIFGDTFLGSDIIQNTQSLPTLPAFYGVTTPVQFLGDQGIIGATAHVEGTVEPDGAITGGAISFLDFSFISV